VTEVFNQYNSKGLDWGILIKVKYRVII